MFTLREIIASYNISSCSSDNTNPRLLIDRTVRPNIWEDDVRRNIDAIFEQTFQDLYAKIQNARKIGRETECYYEEIAYLQALNIYFIELKDQLFNCSSLAAFDAVTEDYQFDCIRETLNCKFGRGKLMDELVELLGLKTPLLGIDYMAIDDDSCFVFKID
jgi:hypothetical protein